MTNTKHQNPNSKAQVHCNEVCDLEFGAWDLLGI